LLTNIFYGLVLIASVLLVGLVSAQTTKSEGLSGAIGGGVQSSSKYLPGQEEVLQKYTTWTAVTWMICCLFWYLFANHRL